MNDGIDTMRDNNDIAPFKNILNEMYSKDISKKVHSSWAGVLFFLQPAPDVVGAVAVQRIPENQPDNRGGFFIAISP